MSNYHCLALIATQNVFPYLLSLGPNYKKSKMHQMTSNNLEYYKAKGTLYMLTTTPESQIALSFTLQSLVFQVIEVSP